MALYTYVKKKKNGIKQKVRQVSFVLILSGITIIAWISYPIFAFEFFYAPKFGSLVTPLPNDFLKQSFKNEFSHVLGISDTDFTRASIWFPKATQVKVQKDESSYTLSIPKVKIDRANVIVGSEDLAKSLVHFTGPLPGSYGNPVIFGHSTLPFLYNPKDYKTIFTKLPDLNINDDVYLTSDNVTFRYKIYQMKVVSADDLSVLEQNYQDANLTLVTCVPPGTYFNRLIVRARLVKV